MEEEDQSSITLMFRFDAAGEEVSVTVSGFRDPMIALSALKTAGSEQSLTNLLAQMKEKAAQ